MAESQYFFKLFLNNKNPFLYGKWKMGKTEQKKAKKSK